MDRHLNEIFDDATTQRCSMKDDVVTKIEREMLEWFGHVERIQVGRLTVLCRLNVDAGVRRDRPLRAYLQAYMYVYMHV